MTGDRQPADGRDVPAPGVDPAMSPADGPGAPPDPIAALQARADEAEAELELTRARLEAELTRRAERIVALNDEARALGRELTRTRNELERLRRRRAVKLATAAADILRRTGVRARGRAPWTAGGVGVTVAAQPVERHVLRASHAAQKALASAILRGLPSGAPRTGPLVSIIIPTHDSVHLLRQTLMALDTLTYGDVEVIVVDNASADGTRELLRGFHGRFPVTVIENERNEPFGEANHQGAARARGDLLLFLNDDVVPITPDFLGYLVETLASAEDVAAVGARLIYPSRHGAKMGPIHVAADLTLQHGGIAFEHRPSGVRPVHVGAGGDPDGPEARTIRPVAAATAACLLVRRDAFSVVGGFADGYEYGMEDVDLCLRLRAAGWRILVDGRAALWHFESATQKRGDAEARRERQDRNHRLLLERWSPRLHRQVMLDRVAGDGQWSAVPLHVGITISRDDPAAGYGDWYTGHELGDALIELGWRVSYLERSGDAWYDVDPSIDVVIGLLEAHDIRRLPRHVVTVAWVRNWTDRWLAQPWFDEYDMVLVSSEGSRELVEMHSTRRAHVFPIATNPVRFHPPEPPVQPTVDLLFTGNRWGEARGVEAALPPISDSGRTVVVHGRGWDEVAAFRGLARGHLDYGELPAAYGAARLVVDDSPPFTSRYGSVNSRVFDALAAGTLVVSENARGVRELFDRDFPVWDDPESLRQATDALLEDEARRRELIDRYRAIVLERHTYAHRARELRELLVAWISAPRAAVLVGVPSWEVAPAWGDTHFGRDLQRQLERLELPTRLAILPDWSTDRTLAADVVIHLFGLSDFEPRPGQVSVLWNISHPDRVRDDQAARYDLVFVASDRFAGRLAARLGRAGGKTPPVRALHQATDPQRFRPEHGGPAHDLLFVGNSRGVRRAIVDDVTPTTHDLAVYGAGWSPDLLDHRYLRGESVANEDLHRYYAAAKIVLADHWPDMREEGFLSNRLYDALASGAFVISDHVDGIEAEFDGAVVTYRDRSELADLVERYLQDEGERRALAARGRAVVLERHTFARRASVLHGAVTASLASRRLTIVPAEDGPA